MPSDTGKQLTIIAMSGGVDSAVASAILLEKGINLVGITMKVWESEPGQTLSAKNCCTVESAESAGQVAQKLGFAHYTINVQEKFRQEVIAPFVAEYLAGRTPNPCVPCNGAVKFDYLFEHGLKYGAQRVATGHYARISTFLGFKTIFRGLDRNKDQSYFLYSIDPSRIGQIDFPLGEMTKTETREKARSLGLSVAEKPESQEICFVPDGDFGKIIDQQSGQHAITKGPIKNMAGKILGHHKGIAYYTVGQRKGLGISNTNPLYIKEIIADQNCIIVAEKHEIFSRALIAEKMNWFVPPEEIIDLPVTARIRYRHEDAPCRFSINPDKTITVEFEEEQMAVAPGQAVVLYSGEALLGGGIIKEAIK